MDELWSRTNPVRPDAPEIATVRIPPGPVSIKDYDGARDDSLLRSSRYHLGQAKEFYLEYSFEFSHPVRLREWLLYCFANGVRLVSQGGDRRGHCREDMTRAYFLAMLSNQLRLPQLWGHARLRIALREMLRPTAMGWLRGDLQPLAELRPEALARLWRDHPWMQRPAVCLKCFEGQDYATWISALSGRRCRLPSEIEFQRAMQYLLWEQRQDVRPLYGDRWFWTRDWYTTHPSRYVGDPCLYGQRSVDRKTPFKVLKNFHVDIYERGGVVPSWRATNQGCVFVVIGGEREATQRPPAPTAL